MVLFAMMLTPTPIRITLVYKGCLNTENAPVSTSLVTSFPCLGFVFSRFISPLALMLICVRDGFCIRMASPQMCMESVCWLLHHTTRHVVSPHHDGCTDEGCPKHDPEELAQHVGAHSAESLGSRRESS